MALPNEAERLQAAWRALNVSEPGYGWRTIPIDVGGLCRLLAGRHFPGADEAVLIGFSTVRLPPEKQLPQGHGFRVTRIAPGAVDARHDWLAISRRAAGSLDLFCIMTGDLLTLLESAPAAGEDRLLPLLLSRIAAWQDFMARGSQHVLGPEDEVGLFGELTVLAALVERGLSCSAALDAWHGPLGDLHDFHLGAGGIEVKASAAVSGFRASISSLDQLDDFIRHPLFLAAVRLSVDRSGLTLPELAGALVDLMWNDPVAIGMFESLLLKAGLIRALAEQYMRRFVVSKTAVFQVGEGFPRIVRRMTHPAIVRAAFDIEIDMVDTADVGLDGALCRLGTS